MNASLIRDIKPIRVVGLDWATKPKGRALVVLSAEKTGKIVVETVIPRVEDEVVVKWCRADSVDFVGVDTPFGWPLQFIDFVKSWRPTIDQSSRVPSSLNFRHRLTDQIVADEACKSPLSVSSNLIGVSALEWARIVALHSLWPQIDTLGVDATTKPTICEVYPGATMSTVFPRSGTFKTDRYKKDAGIRTDVVQKFADRFGITLSQKQLQEIVGKNSDKTDAFIAGITMLIRASAFVEWSARFPDDDEKIRAQAEGWIFFPIKDSNSGYESTNHQTGD